jgi:hypothetical protein
MPTPSSPISTHALEQIRRVRNAVRQEREQIQDTRSTVFRELTEVASTTSPLSLQRPSSPIEIPIPPGTGTRTCPSTKDS